MITLILIFFRVLLTL